MAKQAWDWMSSRPAEVRPRIRLTQRPSATCSPSTGWKPKPSQHWTIALTANRKSANPASAPSSPARAASRNRPQRIALHSRTGQARHRLPRPLPPWLADEYLKAGDLANFEAILKAAQVRQHERPLRAGTSTYQSIGTWFDATRANMEMKPEVKQNVFTRHSRPAECSRLAAAANWRCWKSTDDAGEAARSSDCSNCRRRRGSSATNSPTGIA